MSHGLTHRGYGARPISGRAESQRLSELKQRTQTTPHRENLLKYLYKRPLSVMNVNFKIENNFFKAFWSLKIIKVSLCGGSKKLTEILFFQEIFANILWKN